MVAVHARGITHKDLKPENLYFDCFGRLTIGGLVRVATKKTKVPAPLLNYLAPEIHQGLAVSKNADIWSVGVILYEMLSGKLPFTGETEAATWKSVVQSDPAPLPQHISSDVKKLVTIMLTKSPDRRPSIDQIVLTKLVTRYLKLLVSYGRLAKNQYEILKGPVDPQDDEVESKPSLPSTKRAPVKDEVPPTKTARERQKEEMKGAIDAKTTVKPEGKSAKDAIKGTKEEVKVEKKELGKEAAFVAKKEAEVPK